MFESNPREQRNCVTLKGGLDNLELEEGGKVPSTESEEKIAEIKTLPFGGVSKVVVPEEFPHKLKDLGSFSIPCMVS